MSLAIPVCTACGTAVFPPRLLCPRCGASAWRDEEVEGGVVEGTTGHVAEVRTPLGPLVVARLEEPAHAVSLELVDGVVVAVAHS